MAALHPMPTDLPVGYTQLAKIAMRIWTESRNGSDYESMKELVESMIAHEAAGQGLGYFDMMKMLQQLKLAVTLIQESLETYLGPFVEEGDLESLFEIQPHVRPDLSGALLVHFTPRRNDQKTPNPEDPVTDKDAGTGQS